MVDFVLFVVCTSLVIGFVLSIFVRSYHRSVAELKRQPGMWTVIVVGIAAFVLFTKLVK
jgi:hypothetical protein